MFTPIRFLTGLLFLLTVSRAFAFEPFFDDNPATRHAPEPPALTDLDLDVLILCDDWGSRVDRREFEEVMLKRENLDATRRISEALGNRIFSRSENLEDFVRQLSRAWFGQKGFEHVFCGEPGVGRDLGGLHYAPRYWQAQDRGWAGYRPLARDASRRPVSKCRESYLRERIDPPVFNISIAFVNPDDPRNNVKCLGGYHHDMNAERLLIAATAAFKQANRRIGKDETASCFYDTEVPGVEPHVSNLVVRRRAIRTFYPLAQKRPYCRKNRRDYTACLCSRL